jgi:hypothetical protein
MAAVRARSRSSTRVTTDLEFCPMALEVKLGLERGVDGFDELAHGLEERACPAPAIFLWPGS